MLTTTTEDVIDPAEARAVLLMLAREETVPSTIDAGNFKWEVARPLLIAALGANKKTAEPEGAAV